MERTILAEPTVIRASGETFDFDALVRTYGRFVLGVAHAVVRNHEDAEDVAQETFFRAFRAGNPAAIENMKAWLGRVAWRLALNRSRDRSGQRRGLQPEELLRTLPARESGAEDTLLRQERAALLDVVLSSLPRDLRETFVLLAVEEMTSRAAAEILGIPEASVRNRLFRARKLLKEKLAALLEKTS